MSKLSASLIILLTVIFLSGCGGVHRDYYYSPISPSNPSNKEPFGNTKSLFSWQIEQDDVNVTIYSVKLGTKLIFIIGPAIIIPSVWEKPVMEEGPLQLRIAIESSDGARVSFDPKTFVVTTNDDKKYLPLSGCENLPRELEPLELEGRNAWVGCLEYQLDLSEVVPFQLRLGTLKINGRSADFPPIPFVYKKGSHSS